MRQCSQHKERFGTEKHCKEWISVWNKTADCVKGEKQLTKAYLCPECLTWHATSQKQIDIENTLVSVKSKVKQQIIELEKLTNDFNALKTKFHKVCELLEIDKQILKKIKELQT